MRAVLCGLALVVAFGASGCGDTTPTVAPDPEAERQLEQQNKTEAKREGKALRKDKNATGEK